MLSIIHSILHTQRTPLFFLPCQVNQSGRQVDTGHLCPLLLKKAGQVTFTTRQVTHPALLHVTRESEDLRDHEGFSR
ncbi:hypothetical protein SY84_02600 [Deinococcus soli (ex Cha et al. 2016)]|uniref:Uncharacterized protein n=1 Tax=Deinococcus soli (ex Cha et al. 2016) TaxID=1309411 RepID=A0A0F7JJ80_9DEIO|nr:hypothetical protein SY84_02600 [Deinococcus soli (ex Cha et al. 2016)]